MSRKSKRVDFVIEQNGIDSIEKIKLGGIEQYILLQGHDVTKPILLFLHGGPSLPLPGVSSRGKDYTIATNVKELVKNFIVVFWDQRGTGKSYHSTIPQHTMNISQFVADAIELTDYLRDRFKQNKIFLAGHSWGTVIGLKVVTAYPDRFYSYVGISQLVSWTENDRLGLEWTKAEAKRRNNQKALKELNSVGEPPFTESFQQWGVLRKWQRNFGTLIYTDEHIKHPGLFRVTLDMIRSKDYSLTDVYNTFVKGFKLVYSIQFIQELEPSIQFHQTSTTVQIPITFIHGTKDVHVFGSLVEKYYNLLNAEQGKQIIWVDKSSHAFHPDDTLQIEQHLIAQLKYITL